MNPLQALYTEQGQSVWLDFIERGMLEDGGLQRFVASDAVRGVTSNPSIFNKAITGGGRYDASLRKALARDSSLTAEALFWELAVEDIRLAADILREVYEDSGGGDGYVSLEVSPRLAHDTEGTIAEARRLWARVDRPNLMIKVPATDEGMPAIEELIAGGINVNATLMFSMRHYENVAGAYIKGLERCDRPGPVASVASFFVSRVDTAVDRELEVLGTPEAVALRGKAAVANSRLVYERFLEIFHGEEFTAVRRRGARVQRPLWASTSTKNPAYPDTKYVDELIGPETVNTIPLATLEAFRDHGRVERTVDADLHGARAVLGALAAHGIDLDAVTEQLQVDGVRAFAEAFDALLAALEARRRELGGV